MKYLLDEQASVKKICIVNKQNGGFILFLHPVYAKGWVAKIENKQTVCS